MAFGIKRETLMTWKQDVKDGKIEFLTHYWLDDRLPNSKTVTKVGCANVEKLKEWGRKYGLKPEWIHKDEKYPHFDLIGKFQKDILVQEGIMDQIERFKL